MGKAIFRFAPSPTGLLHAGNARTGIVNWLYARKLGGQFMLRLDDTDRERSKQEYEDAIIEDLKWLGLDWDIFARQAERMDRYDEIIAQLKSIGRLYPCYETEEELSLKRKVQLSRGLPPIYDRGSLNLTPDQVKAYEAEGRKPHWRFKLRAGDVSWQDEVRGKVAFDGAKLSDPVLIRQDGTPLYTITTIVDDIDFGITHIVRGEDHVTNTAIQIQLFEALDGTIPIFGHLPLITDATGSGLSKRLGSLSLQDLRAERFHPMALNNLLAHLGTGIPVVPHTDINGLVQDFDINHYSRSTPKFDMAELAQINAKLLHIKPFSKAIEEFYDMGIISPPSQLTSKTRQDLENFWDVIRGNLEVMDDVRFWFEVCFGHIPARDHLDRTYIETALALLPKEPWDQTTWSQWTTALKEKTGRKGKDLFHPLRKVLTDCDDGPELKLLLPIIGYDRVTRRLQEFLAAEDQTSNKAAG